MKTNLTQEQKDFLKMIRLLEEAELVNEALKDLENGKTVDGDVVRARLSEKYGF